MIEYVQLKPVLTIITLVLKVNGKFADGNLSAGAGYTYISLATNLSVSLSLYSLVMFWKATHNDLKPFRYGLLLLSPYPPYTHRLITM